MKRSALLAAAAFFVACSAAHAMCLVWDKGAWPGTWPKELEPLRKQARTYEGPMVANRHYLIPFRTASPSRPRTPIIDERSNRTKK